MMGLHDIAITNKINKTLPGVMEEGDVKVDCSKNYCDVRVVLDDSFHFSNENPFTSLGLTGNATIQELLDESTGQWGIYEAFFSVALSSDDICPYPTPVNEVYVAKGFAIVFIALVVIIIVCCYGAKYRTTTTTLDIPL